ncbi:hypothetical protein [Hymenobacter rubripertinctus]|uniref:hypothetical protein n=1 Tax=Hymenobacter rubripertinctus TaxID=2029981 RepID=UPI0015FFB6F6|nr:hypothetical protein [Hymenobacter rubripertinctus]
MERPCLYLDIDDVLLTNRYPAPPSGNGSAAAPAGAVELLKKACHSDEGKIGK